MLKGDIDCIRLIVAEKVLLTPIAELERKEWK